MFLEITQKGLKRLDQLYNLPSPGPRQDLEREFLEVLAEGPYDWSPRYLNTFGEPLPFSKTFVTRMARRGYTKSGKAYSLEGRDPLAVFPEKRAGEIYQSLKLRSQDFSSGGKSYSGKRIFFLTGKGESRYQELRQSELSELSPKEQSEVQILLHLYEDPGSDFQGLLKWRHFLRGGRGLPQSSIPDPELTELLGGLIKSGYILQQGQD